MRLLPVVLLFAVLGCGEAEREVRSRPSPAWMTHPVPERGVTVGLPPGWRIATESLTPDLADPLEVFSAATFPLRHHPAECAHMPSALDDLGQAGVLVTVLERDGGAGDGYPLRPERFAPLPEPSQVECSPAEGELHWFPFSDGGRNFYGMVAFGPTAPAAAQAEGFEVLSRAVYVANAGPN